jgi:hypothetical protein
LLELEYKSHLSQEYEETHTMMALPVLIGAVGSNTMASALTVAMFTGIYPAGTAGGVVAWRDTSFPYPANVGVPGLENATPRMVARTMTRLAIEGILPQILVPDWFC